MLTHNLIQVMFHSYVSLSMLILLLEMTVILSKTIFLFGLMTVMSFHRIQSKSY